MTMRFQQQSVAYCTKCWSSERDRWRVCVMPTIIGSNRVNVWAYGEDPYGFCRVYCCGPGPGYTIAVVRALLRILEALDESVTAAEVAALLPVHTMDANGRELRPISTDPALFATLMKLAGITTREAATLWDVAQDELMVPLSLSVIGNAAVTDAIEAAAKRVEGVRFGKEQAPAEVRNWCARAVRREQEVPR